MKDGDRIIDQYLQELNLEALKEAVEEKDRRFRFLIWLGKEVK